MVYFLHILKKLCFILNQIQTLLLMGTTGNCSQWSSTHWTFWTLPPHWLLKCAEQLDPQLAPLVLPCLPSMASLVTDFQSETALTVNFCSTHSPRTSPGSSTPPLPPRLSGLSLSIDPAIPPVHHGVQNLLLLWPLPRELVLPSDSLSFLKSCLKTPLLNRTIHFNGRCSAALSYGVDVIVQLSCFCMLSVLKIQ